MFHNQRVHSRLEQKPVIKFPVAEKYKPCEIYQRISDMFGEVCFSQKMYFKWGKHGFDSASLSRKDSPLYRNALSLR